MSNSSSVEQTGRTSSSSTSLDHHDQQQQQEDLAAALSTSNAAVTARILSGSFGSIVTALCVTPLEVVKVHFQNAKPNSSSSSASTITAKPANIPQNVFLCPKGCGTFVLNNGLYDCVLPKCAVPYFDERGNLKCFDPVKDQTLKNNNIHAATSSVGSGKMSGKTSAAKSSSSIRPPGTFAMVRNIFVKEGFTGIYAGLAPTLVMGVPSTVFYYATYDEILARARHNDTTTIIPDAWLPFFAGSSARLMSTLVTAPLELIRTRQASRVGEGLEVRGGMLAEFKSIIREEGIGGAYRGLGPTLWRDVPFSGIYWLCLEQFRILYGSRFFGVAGEDHVTLTPSPLQQAGLSFLSGASAGMVAAACTTPFDVVKTRQQSETLMNVATHGPEMAACCNHDGHVVYEGANSAVVTGRSVWSDLQAIHKTEGVTGLWRGNQTRMIKVAPSCAIMIGCYELGKSVLTPSD